jgi:hypothetical protein
MTSRRSRNRRVFNFDSLEMREAPTSLGVMSHAALVLHHNLAAAHVRHLSDSEVNHKKETREASSSVDSSQDHSTDLSGGSTSKDQSSRDGSSIDPRTDR